MKTHRIYIGSFVLRIKIQYKAWNGQLIKLAVPRPRRIEFFRFAKAGK